MTINKIMSKFVTSNIWNLVEHTLYMYLLCYIYHVRMYNETKGDYSYELIMIHVGATPFHTPIKSDIKAKSLSSILF